MLSSFPSFCSPLNNELVFLKFMVTTSSFNAEGGKLIIRIRVLEKERRADRLKEDDRGLGKKVVRRA